MFHRGFLLLCLLAASLIATTTIHARELPGVVLECAGAVHTERDPSPSPADPEKGVAHHHGCHGASSFMPGENATGERMDLSAQKFVRPPASTLAGRHSGPDLRPPIA